MGEEKYIYESCENANRNKPPRQKTSRDENHQ